MNDTDWESIFQDRDSLLKAAAISYFGLAMYLALKKNKPPKKVEPLPEERPRKRPLTLSEMISKMIEETYGIQK
ncbi:MAG: hypothetical protein HXS41_05475 [Theionarchaea archaeon]|nr:hypothetical protein [Theionarchaea archaeon]MBU7000585.1 hypothetical protein [Theionarchaea archaeon]MBU7020487.1 hypothetical protein [Theionarchaea archaeon]MBU7034471.1 hypothetical protein [Theionarchaea archaeon]MBU7039780.1 hypothetical protein [Theionarchaea archaeon]